MLKFETDGKGACMLEIKGNGSEILMEMCGAIESIVYTIYKRHADDPNLMHDGAHVATAAALSVRNGINRAKQHAKEAQHEAENG